MPPAIFQLIAKSISNMVKDFYRYPLEFDDSFIPISVGVKQVHIDNQTRCDSHSKPQPKVFKPCALCSYKGFVEQHYPLSIWCGVGKLSSNEILQVTKATKTCTVCVLAHSVNIMCYPNHLNGTPKTCSKRCQHNRGSLHAAACMHSNQSPSITVSKVGSNKSILMMETLENSPAPNDIQYDSGCQFSLISKSAIQLLSANPFFLGINILDFNGQGQLFDATEVKLNLFNHMFKLVVVDTNLNSGSGYSFPTPYKWRACTWCYFSHRF